MKKLPKMIFYIVICLATVWLLVTIHAQYAGKSDTILMGNENSAGPSVLVLFKNNFSL